MASIELDPHRRVRLRPVRPDDLPWIMRMMTDRELVGPHNWPGSPPDPVDVEHRLRDGLETDGLTSRQSGTLVVEFAGGPAIGEVSWRSERWGPSPRSR